MIGFTRIVAQLGCKTTRTWRSLLQFLIPEMIKCSGVLHGTIKFQSMKRAMSKRVGRVAGNEACGDPS